MTPRTLALSALFACALSAFAGASVAASKTPAPAPTLGGSGAAELTCEPMPGEAAGHFVCEDADSFKKCKALEGKGKVRLEGATTDTKVVMCVQGG